MHDYLKPIKIKYLKTAGYITYLVIHKIRFSCKNCLKIFAESNYINGVKKTLSNKLIQKILKDLLSIDEDLKKGYELKELFLDIVNHAKIDDVESQLLCWIELCRETKIEEFIEVSNTIENWLPYIVNSFIGKRLTNGYTEGLNNKIKVIKRNGYGYRNFTFFRLRILYILNGTISGRGKRK